MPLLSKKSFLKPHSAPSSQQNKKNISKFKNPLLTKTNIDKILLKDTAVNEKAKKLSKCSQQEQLCPTSLAVSHEDRKNHSSKITIRKTTSSLSVVSMHLSFENDSKKELESASDISSRMNEPQIKEAYLQFVKSLSQSSAEEHSITSSPLIQKTPEPNFLTPLETSLKKIGTSEREIDDSKNEKRSSKKSRKRVFKKSPDSSKKTCSDDRSNKRGKSKESQKSSNEEARVNIYQKSSSRIQETESPDSGISFSQEILNRTDVKAAYIKFMKSSLENDDTMKINRNKGTQKKRRRIISSSSEESLDKSLEMKKNKNKKTSVIKEKINHKDKTKKKESGDEENPYKHLSLVEKMALIQESRNVGLYAVCDICDKARYLPHIKDPLDLPDKWYCAMNPDANHNKCSDPEEIQEDKDYLIDNLYNAGSVVWAQVASYPWWPAMVEDDSDYETYFWLEGNSMSPTWYHVTFFDSKDVTRAWLRPQSIKPFKINMNKAQFRLPKKNKYMSRISAAFKQACDAIELPLIERLRKYSFINRYNKPIGKTKQAKLEKSEKVVKVSQKSTHMLKGNMLTGHKTVFSKEQSLSSLEIPLKNQKERGKNASVDLLPSVSNDDISVVLNDYNWTEASLSVNLFD